MASGTRKRDIPYAIAVPLDVARDRIVVVERARQGEAQTVLLEKIRGAPAQSGLGTGVSGDGKSESGCIVVRGLLRIADEEMQVVPVEFVQRGVHAKCGLRRDAATLCAGERQPFAQDRIVHGQRALLPREEHVVDAARLGMAAQDVPNCHREFSRKLRERGVVEVGEPSEFRRIVRRLACQDAARPLGPEPARAR